MSDRTIWLGTFMVVASVYLLTAHWGVSNFDSTAAAWPGWALVHHHTLHLEDIRGLPTNPWIVHSHGHLVSSRMPGVVLIGVPAQALMAWTGSVLAPSVVTASLVSAAAVANMAVLLRELTTAKRALLAAGVLAFGSAMWTVAGAELWTHGPDALWLSAGLLAVQRSKYLLSGLLFAPALATRPHLAVVVMAVGVAVAYGRRTFRPLFLLGVPAALALLGVALYNQYLFHQFTLTAGTYSYAAPTNAGLPAGVPGAGGYLTTTAGLLASPMRGLLAYTPIAILALLWLRPAWRRFPDWGRGASVGGLGYLLAQAKVNGFEGGRGFYGSRLTVEVVLLWTPLVFLACQIAWERHNREVVALLAALSVAFGVIGALFGHEVGVPIPYSPWTTWLPYRQLRTSGPAALSVAAILGAGILLVTLLARRGTPLSGAPAARASEPARAAS